MIQLINGLKPFIENYQCFIVDLRGVLYDGDHVNCEALSCLKYMRHSGKKVCILSNAPRRSYRVIERCAEMGLTSDYYDFLLTSGEDAWLQLKNAQLKNEPENLYYTFNKKVFPIMAERDYGFLDDLDLEPVHDIQKSNFILAIGWDGITRTIDDFYPLLDQALISKQPMICVNPDLNVIHKGKEELCAGSLAVYYQEKGGKVYYHGKPHPEVYKTCLEKMGLHQEPTPKVLAIGDSLHTDVYGAHQANLDALWILGGVHAAELGLHQSNNNQPNNNQVDDYETKANMERLCIRKNVKQMPKIAMVNLIL
ncbi:MAG: TIGR01459 family HAD-type hydrolase [Alphaproteobacteria bacterium]|nr:TIGR01459 family HAD-type hydrolase [Alphaproteobacteria bacterium]